MADARKARQELKELPAPELQARLRRAREELFKLRLANTVGQRLKNPMQIRWMRREIARISTFMRQKNAQG